jgi:hypothetical protein
LVIRLGQNSLTKRLIGGDSQNCSLAGVSEEFLKEGFGLEPMAVG